MLIRKRKVINVIANSIAVCEINIEYANNFYKITSEKYEGCIKKNRAIKNEMLNIATELGIAFDVIKKKDKLVQKWKIRDNNRK